LKEKVRFIFVDLLRGWALLVMIEVHVFNVMLLPSLKNTDWFNILNYINGLVAPSFLFISGFAFMLSTQNKIDELRKFNKSFWKKLNRIFLILIAGYSLHVPILSFRRFINFYSHGTIVNAFNVDILQCIAFGLLLLLAARIIFKSDKVFNSFITISFVLVSILAPVIWKIDFGRFLPIPLAAYFNPQYGSLFPIFPWLGFLLAGAITCRFFLEARDNNTDKNFFNFLLFSGFAFALIGHILLSNITPVSFHAVHPHPLFFVQRLGYVFILLALCWYYENPHFHLFGYKKIDTHEKNFKSSFVIDVGKESLLVYWLHLQIIYRRFWAGKSIVDLFGEKYNVIRCIIGTVLLAILMIIVAKLWGRFKRKYPLAASRITFGVVSAGVIIFFLGF
jgi:uncharacterized membrane protein